MRFERPVLNDVGRILDDLRRTDSTLAIAESCTGGLVGAAVTAVPGASDGFELGVVTYSDEAKRDRLGVPRSTLETAGAVSGPTARAMAAGVRDLADASWGLSITGIAGPTGGRPGKPVGTVYLGIAKRTANGHRATARRFNFDGDRDSIRAQTTRTAVERLALAIRADQPR